MCDLAPVEIVTLHRPAVKTGLYGKFFPYGFFGEFKALLKLAVPIVSHTLALSDASMFNSFSLLKIMNLVQCIHSV